MTNRQQKRWCGDCNAVVFSRGHEHGQDVTPSLAERRVASAQKMTTIGFGWMADAVRQGANFWKHGRQ